MQDEVLSITSAPSGASQDRFSDLPSEPSAVLQNTGEVTTIRSATPPSTGRKRGPVVRRRFQKGCFVTEPDGRFYSMFYIDADGRTKQVKRFIGNSREMSERAARREHARIMDEVNKQRGSSAPALRARRSRKRSINGARRLLLICRQPPFVSVRAICGCTSFPGLRM